MAVLPISTEDHSSRARLSLNVHNPSSHDLECQGKASSLYAPVFTHKCCIVAGCKEPTVSSEGQCGPQSRNPSEGESLPTPGRPLLRATPAPYGTSFEQLNVLGLRVAQEKRSSADPTSVSVAAIDPHLEPIVVHLAHVGVPFERPGSHDPETRPPLTLSGRCYGHSVRTRPY